MIINSSDPRAFYCQILDSDGSDLCKKYMFRSYNTETQVGQVAATTKNGKGETVFVILKGNVCYVEKHFPGSMLILR